MHPETPLCGKTGRFKFAEMLHNVICMPQILQFQLSVIKALDDDVLTAT